MNLKIKKVDGMKLTFVISEAIDLLISDILITMNEN